MGEGLLVEGAVDLPLVLKQVLLRDLDERVYLMHVDVLLVLLLLLLRHLTL